MSLVEWRVSMGELFRRPPDLVVPCPEWLAGWMEWQGELDAGKLLPKIPLDPVGYHLGSEKRETGRCVANIFRDVVTANGWSIEMAGPALGVSATVVTRLLSAQGTTIRLYRPTANRLLEAAGRSPRLLAEVRKMIDTGAGER